MKIGQAAQLTGLTISNIRFYERKGLLEPERNDQSKYRNYSEQDIRRLKQIILYRKMNMPIEKIASMLDGSGSFGGTCQAAVAGVVK